MRKLLFYFKDHLIFSGRKYFIIIILTFLGICIWVYYSFDIHEWLYHSSRKFYSRFFFYLITYSLAYYFISFLYGYYYKNPKVLSKAFLARSVFIILLILTEKILPLHVSLAEKIAPVQLQYYLSRIFWLLKFPFIVVIVFLIIILISANIKQMTGLRTQNVDFKPFFIALMCIIPIILVVSFMPAFIAYYPKYRTTLAAISSDLPEYLFVLPYEIAYGLNLLSIEIIFRGFLIFGFIHYLGKGSVYPMIGLYCFIHLGKPPLECFSSILGGYILGVIALYSRSIIGGVIIHIGMAWSMELFAWLQKVMNP